MDDRRIVALFWERSDSAIEACMEKYGGRLRRLAQNLLGDARDAEECVNDACLGAWNSIPPQKPDPLLPYLYKILRNQCLKRYRYNTARKRGGDSFDAAYEELENCLAGSGDPADALDGRELSALVNQFVKRLSRADRRLFLGRYWYGESVSSLAERLEITEDLAGVRLSRLRQRLKKFLRERGALE